MQPAGSSPSGLLLASSWRHRRILKPWEAKRKFESQCRRPSSNPPMFLMVYHTNVDSIRYCDYKFLQCMYIYIFYFGERFDYRYASNVACCLVTVTDSIYILPDDIPLYRIPYSIHLPHSVLYRYISISYETFTIYHEI